MTFIKGIDNIKDANWYASVMLNRLMFIYFLQKKGFLDDGNINYLQDKLKVSKTKSEDLYYQEFLQTLFFDGFGKSEKFRKLSTPALIGKIKYINGGLFLPHYIEEKYQGRITISDAGFEDIFQLFSGYTWHLDDTPSGKDDEINPDVLGYIFEKYIKIVKEEEANIKIEANKLEIDKNKSDKPNLMEVNGKLFEIIQDF